MFYIKKSLLIGNKNIYYYDEGEGIPILFIHGFPTSSFLWRKIINILVERGYRCIAPDLMGFGDTLGPVGEDWGLESQADLIYNFYQNLDSQTSGDLPEPVWIAGHEIGGAISLILALQRPGIVKGLVLSDCAFYTNWPTKIMKYLKLAAKRDLIWASGFKSGVFISYLKLQLKNHIKKNENLNETIEEYIRPYKCSPSSREKLKKVLRDLNPRLTNTLSNFLYKIKKPTLIIWGENDPLIDKKYGTDLYEKINNSSLKTIKNCSHFPPEDSPVELSDAIDNFIKTNIKEIK
jgi:pimeloyl-ACP methyl ester carboxylesterase